jgi:hypothetical protein
MKNIKTMEDAIRHLELEKHRLEANKPKTDIYTVDSNSQDVKGKKNISKKVDINISKRGSHQKAKGLPTCKRKTSF